MRNFFKFSLALLVLFGMSSVRAADIALNFYDGSANSSVAGNTVDGMSDWVDSPTSSSGTVSGLGSGGVTATYYGAWWWDAGSSTTPNQMLYRSYLDDGDGGNSYYNGDEIGVSVTLTGLSNWLASVGARPIRSVFMNRMIGRPDQRGMRIPASSLSTFAMGLPPPLRR